MLMHEILWLSYLNTFLFPTLPLAVHGFFAGQYLISDLRGEVTTNKFYINFCLFKS